jgi:hypothetical protein
MECQVAHFLSCRARAQMVIGLIPKWARIFCCPHNIAQLFIFIAIFKQHDFFCHPLYVRLLLLFIYLFLGRTYYLHTVLCVKFVIFNLKVLHGQRLVIIAFEDLLPYIISESYINWC